MPRPNDVFWSVLQTGEVFGHAWDGPGTMKTRSIEVVNRALGRQMYTLIGSIREPADIGGYQAVTGCVGDDAAHEFSKWEKTLDLPDPEKVLQNVIAASKAGRPLNGEVPILERADQTLAFLGALCDRVLHHNLCRERWEAGMEVIGSMWSSWKELCIIGARPMSAAYQAGWKIPAEYASEAMPLMVRAGMFGGLKA